MDFVATSLPSTESTPVPPLPKPGTVGLEVEDDRVLAGVQLRSFPHRPFQVEQVIEEDHPAAIESQFALAQEKTIAAEASAIGDDHAFCAACGDFHLGGDLVGLVQNPRSAAIGNACQFSRVVEVVRPAVRFGRGAFQRPSVELSSGSTSYFAAS